jgi:hypothetical protein
MRRPTKALIGDQQGTELSEKSCRGRRFLNHIVENGCGSNRDNADDETCDDEHPHRSSPDFQSLISTSLTEK